MKTKAIFFKCFHPFSLMVILMISYSVFHTSKNERLNSIISSDGRGYYAFLPSFFIYGSTGGNERNIEIEQSYSKEKLVQTYLVKDENGKAFNKYFPGVAILQTPFFGLAYIYSWLFNYPIDGYSLVFRIFYYLGSLFYAVLGMLFFTRSIRDFFELSDLKSSFFTLLFYCITPLLYYSENVFCFSHSYSFFLFGFFTLQLLKMSSNFNTRSIFILGMTVGLIFLVRPSDLTILLLIPFLLGDSLKFNHFMKALFVNKSKLGLIGLIGFLSVVMFLFFIWKWQTGKWLLWSYSGEGFYFFKPHLLDGLFSFRAGIFVNTPVLVLSFIGLTYMFIVDKWKATFMLIYLLINFWVITSWWCWDYETSFGCRPFTEHLFFALFPLIVLIKRFFYISIVPVFVLLSISLIRYWEITTDFFTHQRFTKENYFESLCFWDLNNKGRWNFTRSCEPFGELINSTVLFDRSSQQKITSKNEFVCSSEMSIHFPRTNERFYCRIELDKKFSTPRTTGVIVVVDAYNSKDLNKRFYLANEMYNDKNDKPNSWKKFVLETLISDCFQEFDTIKIYIWNQSKKEFYIKNVKITLEEYKN